MRHPTKDTFRTEGRGGQGQGLGPKQLGDA